ncbi:sugar nucleotide-binding protein [Aeromicrobium sp. UC242_57]|uniref:sugar nucleotide-binding protein n=1 Tax=Aeromicrobium sp. UC242_57 TaxID=3374624 RepID=UPI0037A2D071
MPSRGTKPSPSPRAASSALRVDLRAGDSFGATFHVEIDPSTAVFIPRGVANSFQTLEDGTAYTYLVNDHWSPDAKYTNVNLLDETAAIPWPLPLAEVSDKDKAHPRLADVTPVAARRTLIIGADGHGRALRALLPDALALTRAELDLTDPASFDSVPWRDVDTVINAAAYTNVDGAETPEGRTTAWAVNVTAVAELARRAIAHGLTLVTVSSDYVFDGTAEVHQVDELVSPLGVYGQTKAAGEAVTSTVPKHYIVRTSWVVGDGPNFVATMQRLARGGVSPSVVDDQHGRLTTADELAAGILDLVRGGAPYGIHHVTGGGPVKTWADIAREVFVAEGRSADDVTGVSTYEYTASQQAGQDNPPPISPRPKYSALH